MRHPGRRINTIVAVLVLASAVTALAQTPTQTIMDRNRVILLLQDNGEIGSSGSSVAGGGSWLAQTNQYIFSSGPNLGATIASPGGGLDTVLYLGGPFSQVTRGSLEFPELGEFWDSTIPFERENMPAPCRVDDFRIAQFPSLQPFAGEPFPGFADQTVCIASNDVQGAPCTACNGFRAGVEVVETLFSFGVPSVQDFVFVAFRVFNRSEFVTAANTPAVAAGIQMAGPYDLQNTILAIAIDPDIGNATDDQISFLPDVQTMVFWDSDFAEPQFQGTPGFGGISYLKTPINPETGEEAGLQSFSLFANGTTRPDPNSKEEWYQVMTGDPEEVLFEVAPTDVRGMASSGPFLLPAGEFVEIYAAYFFANVSGSPPTQLLAEDPFEAGGNDDPAFNNFRNVQLTAQATFDAGFVVPTAPPKPDFELIPGENQITIVWNAEPVQAVNPFAKVARDPFARLGNGQPDPEAPGRGVFLEADQVIFDPSRDQGGLTGFVTAATAGLTGREVTNAAFEADFTIQDFEGFNVYRSRTGLASDAELIAQFDLSNGIVGGTFCTAATAVFDQDDGGFEGAVCTAQQLLNIGNDTGLSFAVVDRGGSFPDPSTGPGLINGIPIFYTVTSFAVNTGQTPVDLPVDEAFAVLVPPAAPLVLESGLAPLQQVTPRSDASSFVNAGVGEAELLSGSGTPLNPSGDIPLDSDGNLVGPIPPASGWTATVTVIQPTEIPADFELRFVIDSIPVAYNFLAGDVGHSLGIDAFTNLPEGDARGRRIFFHVTDGSGNVLQTPEGEAAADFITGFIAFDGSAVISSPTMSILSPTDPNAGVALTASFSVTVGERNDSCPRTGTCLLLTGEGGSVPASVANHSFQVGVYGQLTYRDIEFVWSNQGGALSLSRVHDITHDVDLSFQESFGTEGWGFAAPTGLGAEEEAFANDIDNVGAVVPRTADGRVLYGDPLWTALNGQNFSFDSGLPQAAAEWTDLPVLPNAFSLLANDVANFTARIRQEGAFRETAALFTCPVADGAFACADAGAGHQGTRLWVAGQWLDLAFSSLPADGETWLVKLGSGQADAPRTPPPGTSIAIQLSGGSNDLATADLSAIRVVPNPFIAANEITRGNGLQRILFTNLPPQATIRIYTISGNLVRVLEHADGSGTAEWDVRTRFDLLVASGNYYFHVTTPDGRTHLGRFAVVN